MNWTGEGLSDVDVGTGEHGIFATSSLGNFLSSGGSISLSRFDITPADVSFLIGCLDALAVAAVAFLAIWFERVILPATVKAEARTTVTPDAYSLFVSGLPRRLPAEEHEKYAQLLKEHFERQLNAQIAPNLQLQGWKVISSEEQSMNEPNTSGCFGLCGNSGKDYRGRKLGVIASVEGPSCFVRWPEQHGRLGLPEEIPLDKPPQDGVKAPGVLQAGLARKDL